jgi:hypothetical protein
MGAHAIQVRLPRCPSRGARRRQGGSTGRYPFVLESLSAKYQLRPKEITAAMGAIEDTVGDLLYEFHHDREQEVEDAQHP